MSIKLSIQKHLKMSGMSATDLARASGVSKQCISDWQAGVQPRSLAKIKRIADIFGVTLDEFLSHPLTERKAKPSDSYIAPLGFETEALCTAVVDLNGNFSDANNNLLKFLGCEKPELLSSHMLEYIHYYDLERFHHHWSKLFKDQIPIQNLEVRYLSSKQETKWFRIHSARQAQSCVQIVGEDVTDQFAKSVSDHSPVKLNDFLNWVDSQYKLFERTQQNHKNFNKTCSLVLTRSEDEFLKLDSASKAKLNRILLKLIHISSTSKKPVWITPSFKSGLLTLTARFHTAVSLDKLKFFSAIIDVEEVEAHTLQFQICA